MLTGAIVRNIESVLSSKVLQSGSKMDLVRPHDDALKSGGKRKAKKEKAKFGGK